MDNHVKMSRAEWWVAWACAGVTLAMCLTMTGCQTTTKTITIPLPAVEYSAP